MNSRIVPPDTDDPLRLDYALAFAGSAKPSPAVKLPFAAASVVRNVCDGYSVSWSRLIEKIGNQAAEHTNDRVSSRRTR
jgi:hypothetical protein